MRIQSLLLSAVALLVISTAPVSTVADDPPGLATDAFRTVITTPPVQFAESAGGVGLVEIAGHTTRTAPVGAPDIPYRTVLVAIPEGSAPRLEWRSAPLRPVPGPLPRAVGRPVHRLTDGDRAELNLSRGDERTRMEILQRRRAYEYDRDGRFFNGTRVWPERTAWLGRTGYLRDQRYVELHLAPARWQPEAGGLTVVDEIDVTVHFDGVTIDPRAIVPAPIGRFEDVYRSAFANYEQGRLFRRRATGSAAPSVSRALAGGPSPFKIYVRDTGIIRLDHATLVAAGVVGLAPDPTAWRLTNRGEQVPLQIGQNPGNDSLLEPGEWVQFYGQALDDEPKTRLNTDLPSTDDDIYEARDFSDTNVYWLELDGAPGQPTMVEADGQPQCGGCAVPSWFDETAHFETDDVYLPLNGADPYYWWPILSTAFPPDARSIPIPLPGLFSGGDPATLRVRVRGVSPYSLGADANHPFRVTLRDDIGTALLVDEPSFVGRSIYQHELVYNAEGGPLTDTASLDVDALVVPLSPTNDMVVDWVEMEYRRTFEVQPIADHLEFGWPDGDEEFEVSGFSTISDLEVYELPPPGASGVIAPRRLTSVEVLPGGPPFTVRFRMDQDGSGAERRFLVSAGATIALPALSDIVQDTPSALKDQANQADMIVIAHPDALDMSAGSCVGGAPTGCLPELLAWRATAAGGGLTSTVALIEDVQDEFNHGLEGPDAIREFMRWALSTEPGEGWAEPRPSYLMLLGDGSLNYKGGTAEGNLVPTQMMFRETIELGHYASDNLLAAVVGDDSLADLVVGRVPARSVAEANTTLEKILSYERTPAAGPWREHVMLLSDRGHTGNNPGEALLFEQINNSAEFIAHYEPMSVNHIRYWTDLYSQLPALTARTQMHDAIVDGVNGDDSFGHGAAIVQFTGHGNFFIWSDDFYWDERDDPNIPGQLEFDSLELTNAPEYPWLMAHNCLTGGFHIATDNTLGEAWLRREGGGAMGVFGPSGLSFNFIGIRVVEELWDELFGPRKAREVALPVMRSLTKLCTQGSTEACQHYILLGDPASRLNIRGTEPATAVTATSGNFSVTLDWTASATPGTTYDVYRFSSLFVRLYEKVNVAPIAGTSLVDSGLENAKPYWYHVVAVDPDGFSSRWSHFNTDCDTSGPDCLTATPLNPGPPDVPSGLVLTDLGVGTALRANWDPSLETDLAYYTLEYGTTSGVYDQSLEIGIGSNAIIPALTPGVTYYVALSATNTSGNTSALSPEADESPIEALGFRPPAFIDDLRVAADGVDALLSWSEITNDAYGKPTDVVRYEILRGIAPNYGNASLVEIAECLVPCDEYRDVGAIGAADGYFYRVRAVNDLEDLGSLGSEYPRWTSLSVEKSLLTPGDLSLSWDEVTTTIAGTPADISHYLVYAWDQPISRVAIRDGRVPAPTIVNGTELEITPDAGTSYLRVIVMDVRGNMSTY